MTHYTNTKTILEQTAAAAIHNGALTLTVPALHIPSPGDAVYAIDELIVWLDDVRSYIDKNFAPTPVLTKPLAFDASTIVEVKAAALRSMAVTEVRAITAMGLIFVRNAADIRWTPDEPFGAVRAGGEWIPLTVRGLETWAVEEGLNWRRDDGTVVLWLESSAGGGGGGGVPEEMPYIQVKTLRQAGIISVKDMQYGDQEIEDHLNDGWSIKNVTYLDAANVRFVLLQREMMVGGGGDPAGQHKPLHSMTAAEAREYARQMQATLATMLDDLNQIPGVRATGRIDVQSEETYDEKPILVIDDIDAGVSYAERDVTGVLETLDELLEDWEESIPGKRFTIAIDLITFAEWKEIFADDEDGAA